MWWLAFGFLAWFGWKAWRAPDSTQVWTYADSSGGDWTIRPQGSGFIGTAAGKPSWGGPTVNQVTANIEAYVHLAKGN